MAAKRSSTIGYEQRHNVALQIKDKQRFIEHLTTKMPAVPDHFHRCSEINRTGSILTETLPRLMPLDPRTFKTTAENSNTVALDTRGYAAFGGQHIPNAYHIDFDSNFATFAGWIIPPEKDILLVSASRAQAQEAVIWLRRVGLDNTIGFLDGGMPAWANHGLPANHVGQLSAEELYALITRGERVVLVDVRARSEFEINNIKGAINIPAPELRTRFPEVDKNRQLILICRTGHRSSLAASLLEQHGFEDCVSVAGGMEGYSTAGYAPECPVCSIPHGPRFFGKQ
jgi:rhodanese-related sulfurtransferase